MADDPHWVADAAWFEAHVADDALHAPATRGCCPVAVVMYQRYAGNNYRYCTDRLGELQRVRPRARSRSWRLALHNASVVVVGDSLAEQLFISALCLAWTEGAAVSVRMERSGGCDTCVGTTWAAQVSGVPAWRYIRAGLGLPHSRIIGEASAVLHGMGPNNDGHKQAKQRPQHLVRSLLDRYDEARRRRRPARVVLAEEMSEHWPGGAYAGQDAGAYPPSERMCLQHAPPNGSNAVVAELNRAMHEEVRARDGQGFAVLSLEALTRSRGDAHVGPTPPALVTAGPRGRDCLHGASLPASRMHSARPCSALWHGRSARDGRGRGEGGSQRGWSEQHPAPRAAPRRSRFLRAALKTGCADTLVGVTWKTQRTFTRASWRPALHTPAPPLRPCSNSFRGPLRRSFVLRPYRSPLPSFLGRRPCSAEPASSLLGRARLGIA
jgi:hypothetical protein